MDTVAPTVAPFTFDRSKKNRMLGWCGLNPMQEILITLVWKQLREGTTKTGKKDFLTHLLDPSNVGYEEVNIFLSKQMVADITTQNFGFGYTTSYGASHHRVRPSIVMSLDHRPHHNVPARYLTTSRRRVHHDHRQK